MVESARSLRVRDFGCGELLTVASGGSASLHSFRRESTHPHPKVEHAYPSHSLVFTDLGEWRYHGLEPEANIDSTILIAGTSLHHYVCTHPRGTPNECFVVAIRSDAFDGSDRLFPKPLTRVTPDMLALRRAMTHSAEEPERLEGLAFSLYDIVSRAYTPANHERGVDFRVAYAKRLIQDRCSKPVTIASIAAELHLSRFTFTRRFLAREGMSPHAYMTRIRIDRAKAQLEKTRLSIGEIAASNGFSSLAHLSNAFRRIVGCSPSAYRSVIAR